MVIAGAGAERPSQRVVLRELAAPPTAEGGQQRSRYRRRSL